MVISISVPQSVESLLLLLVLLERGLEKVLPFGWARKERAYLSDCSIRVSRVRSSYEQGTKSEYRDSAAESALYHRPSSL